MENKKLYVGNLDYAITKEQLSEIFSEYGEVAEVIIITGKGFGFVEFAESSEAEAAKEALDGKEFNGRNMKVDFARPKRENRNFRR